MTVSRAIVESGGRIGIHPQTETSRNPHRIGSSASEKPAITLIQPLAMRRRPDGNAAFLRTPDGRPLLVPQPYHKEITIVDYSGDLEEPAPQPRRLTRILQALR